jgi:selenocysteine lyase/cysteine desulfurase
MTTPPPSVPPTNYVVTGCAAHSRIGPLLPKDWVDTKAQEKQRGANAAPHFLWENAPRHETKEYRDYVQCYSHLPNGLAVLDSKWALARLFTASGNAKDAEEAAASTLESHCFRGVSGFQQFCKKVGMFTDQAIAAPISVQGNFPDLLDDRSRDRAASADSTTYPPVPRNLWVVKDDMSNGAGGIWMVSPDNAASFAEESPSSLSLEHRYVAQQYTWPPVLFGGKKCHVRVYGVLTSDGCAYVHRQCFLHVANEMFNQNAGMEEDSVHITNCCANSHDESKFAGEICADLLLPETDANKATECGQPIVPLGPFFKSIAASVALLAKRTFPFLKGGEANGGFEYLGMDFILSYAEDNKTPVAYMLEVNSPPSQDTATGLPHAENLHNTVISDLMHLWVLPCVSNSQARSGGWQCVHKDSTKTSSTTGATSSSILPSKAVILNKIRWAIFERKRVRRDEEEAYGSNVGGDSDASTSPVRITGSMVAKFARAQFPYYTSRKSHDEQGASQIFMESAGGAQVPQVVVDAMSKSLSSRHRAVKGAEQRDKARTVAKTLFGCSDKYGQQSIYFGTNATTLLQLLANRLSRSWQAGDEIVLCTENHEANTRPWVETAEQMGVTVKWWSVKDFENGLKNALSSRTKLVACSHASNLLGQTRDLVSIASVVQEACGSNGAQIVVDGVAAIPHVDAALDGLPDDAFWYVASCHKLFGPHLGILCGPQSAAAELELGTVNYEACAGLIGLGEYFGRLATFSSEQSASQSTHSQKDRKEATACSKLQNFELTREHVVEAYRRIEILEEELAQCLLQRFNKSSPKLRILEADNSSCSTPARRLPIVAFSHQSISPATIVKELAKHRVVCRQANFKCSEMAQAEFCFDKVTRLSLAHYNTIEEIDFVMNRLEELPGWR